MSDSGAQLTLSWPMPDSFAAEDFLVGDANQQAWDMLARWPDWPEPVMRLSGPAGVGKTHLASIFARRVDAVWLPDASMRLHDVAEARPAVVLGGSGQGSPDPATIDPANFDTRRPIVIDACDAAAIDEHGLFHLLNRIRADGGAALLASRTSPQHWGLKTADLVSRLRLCPVVELSPPDDALFRAILVKLFHDRQLVIDVSVADYLSRRLDRSVVMARELVARIDAHALSLGRRVTRALVADMLRDGPFGDDPDGEQDLP